MKWLFYILIAWVFVTPALAEGELDKKTVVATASYVDGAYNVMETSKQDKLTSTNVIESGSGPIVTSVIANDGNVTVSKAEITIPSGTQSGPTSGGTRVEIWFE